MKKACLYATLAAMVLPCAALAQSSPSGLDKIMAYAGTWKIQTEHFATEFSKPGKENSQLRNECWRSAGFYACDQFVDGESKALIVFTYDEKENVYYSHAIPATGGAGGGSGKLVIDGNVWTFPWEDKVDGKTVYFRVVNVFTAPDTIEYRQEYSRDNLAWTVNSKGIEKKEK
jgi:hypothetical protein